MWTIAKEGYSEAQSVLTLPSLDENAKYVFATGGVEVRGHAPVWVEALASRAGQCVEVVEQAERKIVARSLLEATEIALTDAGALASLLGDGVVYIDISGMSHHVWAPLLKAALKNSSAVRVVYFEPQEYKAHQSPSSTGQFDLSKGFRGVEPIPGFANLVGPPSESKTIFVTFLGFEGPRARQVAMTLDPIPPTIPVVGLPGFRIEYPQVTLSSNQDFLIENYAGRNVRFASASCPFEAYSVLVEIRRDNPGTYIYVAPLGTKPHALGAICFALDHPQDTEIMYDHPVRAPGRTSGVGVGHIYHLKG
jgi:hypothetical protein